MIHWYNRHTEPATAGSPLPTLVASCEPAKRALASIRRHADRLRADWMEAHMIKLFFNLAHRAIRQDR